MPSTPSPNLGLVLNTSADNFALSDFLTNWGKIDSHPGISVVSSTPVDGSPGAWTGQTVYCTVDKFLHTWDGTHWRVPSLPLGWHFEANPSLNITQGSGSPYNSSNFTFSTPLDTYVFLMSSFDVHIDDVSGKDQGFNGSVLIDGVSVAGTHINNAVASSSAGVEIFIPVAGFQSVHLTQGSHTLKIQAWRDSTASGDEAVSLENWRVHLISIQKGTGSM